jgi:hypothetical protein
MLNLLQADTARITPQEHSAWHDHAPAELAKGTPSWLREDLVSLR